MLSEHLFFSCLRAVVTTNLVVNLFFYRRFLFVTFSLLVWVMSRLTNVPQYTGVCVEDAAVKTHWI